MSLTLVEDNAFVFKAVTGNYQGIVPGQWLDYEQSLPGRVVRSKQALIMRAPETFGSSIIAGLQARGYRTSLMVPMISNGVILGTLNFSTFRENAFDVDDARRGEAVARWIGSQLLIRKFADQMERLAMVDPTTGQANRRAFMTRAATLIEEFVSDGHGFAVVLFDLDHFKRVNDRYGHEAGDMVLKASTEIVARLLEERALLGRLGGEEFALLLPGKDIDAAMQLADRCREALMDEAFNSAGQNFHVTASFGCAVAEPGDIVIDDVLRRADAALYEAKEAGRNRVHRAA